MNTKEIATAVNKNERSVQRWVKLVSDKMSSINDKMSSSTSTNPADYDLEETCLIIEQGLGKNAAAVFKASALQITKPSDVNSRLDRMEAMIEKLLILQIGNNVVNDQNKQLTFNDAPAIPEKSKRAELREIINKYTADRGCNHIEVWTQLYQQIYYRMNINVQLCAKNRGMDKLDYIEKEGLLNEVVSLAKKIFEVK